MDLAARHPWIGFDLNDQVTHVAERRRWEGRMAFESYVSSAAEDACMQGTNLLPQRPWHLHERI